MAGVDGFEVESNCQSTLVFSFSLYIYSSNIREESVNRINLTCRSLRERYAEVSYSIEGD